MGTFQADEIDACLRNGGVVVTASDRAARALRSACNRARRTEGLLAWPVPRIQDWRSFVREAWDDAARDDRLLLSATQEQSIWASIAAQGDRPATLLEGPRHRVAALAMAAHELLALYAPQFLRPEIRSGWQQDAAVFSQWLAEFDSACRERGWLSTSLLTLRLAELLQERNTRERQPLLVVGFDRILPVQRRLLDVWGSSHEAAAVGPAADVHYYHAAGTQAELAACALWCAHRLARNPQARLLVVTQDAATRRGEIERALLRHTGGAAEPRFEFSLGVPLSGVPIAKAARLLLRWLADPLEESEVDWLLQSDFAAASAGERAALLRYMRELRRRSLQRTHWPLDAFGRQPGAANLLPDAWLQRARDAQQRLAAAAGRARTAPEWTEMVPQLLRAIGWPGFRPPASAEFQAAERWQHALDECASLGFSGRRTQWREFLATLTRVLDETLFAPQSRDAPIQIAGPAESAGLTADGVWFLSVDEETWPAVGSPHPFLPVYVQREARMPHASAQLDRELASAMTQRVVSAAPEVCFSYAQQKKDSEARPSRIVLHFAGSSAELPSELRAPSHIAPIAVAYNDLSCIPFSAAAVAGGAGVLTHQSQCPFKAFATARLGAEKWDPAQAGLTPAQRGRLIHAVMHSVWGGSPDGIRTLDELRALPDLEAFAAKHVRSALRKEIWQAMRISMPQRYLELEEPRLTRLTVEWLRYELTRKPFTVLQTEVKQDVNVGNLEMRLRLDRVDRLSDGSLLVIDYKTGAVSPRDWDLPRPEDVQLPLYACFALDDQVGGLLFARIQPGESNKEFAGRVRDAATFMAGISARSSLARNPLNDAQLDAWKLCIEELARDFIAGRAEASPRDYPKTCERCGLETLCRIHEDRMIFAGEETADEPGDIDE